MAIKTNEFNNEWFITWIVNSVFLLLVFITLLFHHFWVTYSNQTAQVLSWIAAIGDGSIIIFSTIGLVSSPQQVPKVSIPIKEKLSQITVDDIKHYGRMCLLILFIVAPILLFVILCIVVFFTYGLTSIIYEIYKTQGIAYGFFLVLFFGKFTEIIGKGFLTYLKIYHCRSTEEAE